jgi:hypothetical protein
MRIIFFLASMAVVSILEAGDVRDIELRRLFEPTPAELGAERAGRIYIYDGLREADIERAMEDEFDRVESMMFIRVKRAVPHSQAKENHQSDTKVTYVEDDDC